MASFVYATLVLVSIPGPSADGRQFVPHLSITISVALVGLSMGVLIYFIHHIATTIQLPQVIASIANDLSRAIEAERGQPSRLEAGPSVAELLTRMRTGGGTVPAPASGYLQFIGHRTLVRLATEKGAAVRLLYRPSHSLVQGHPMAVVCESLCKVTTRWEPTRVHRDGHGFVRVITAHVSYAGLVERAFEKIRQAGRGMPAVMIRQLDALTKIVEHTTNAEQREILLKQAAMILRSCGESVPEPSDRADVRREYDRVIAAAARAGLEPVAVGETDLEDPRP